MLSSPPQDVMTALWVDYQRLRREIATFSAMVRLREMSILVADPIFPDGNRSDWRERLDGVDLTEIEVKNASDQAEEYVARLQRIVGVGGKLIYEEAVHVITMRLELELFTEFCTDRGIALSINAAAADKDMTALAGEGRNRTVFNQARAAVAKNWGMPLKSRWLRDGFR